MIRPRCRSGSGRSICDWRMTGFATVTSVEYLGADSLVEARIADQPLIVRVPGKIGLGEGQTIGLDWDSDHEHFFDTATGKRL
jgi:sn-glycerol 3-phosphate transport system ATP-binding protein